MSIYAVSMRRDLVRYRGFGTTVWLDLSALTLTLIHDKRSAHDGTLEIPLSELVNIDYRERSLLLPGWARVRTATGTHHVPPLDDPYSWRSGTDELKPFVLLCYFIAKQTRQRSESRVARDVLVDELHELRQMIDLWREG